jgi:hypothetical protein
MFSVENFTLADQWVERSKKLMAWAVKNDTRKATYIGSLQREQTGLACECLCPNCGGRLQAVNAGKKPEEMPDGRSLRPHFRHDAGEQHNACLVKMSQIVALQLLIEEQAIYLPEQTYRWPLEGASGNIYTGTATTPGFTTTIMAREWVDEHEAKITLGDGRVVWLRLFGAVGSGHASDGDAVISIKVDDPEVSTWPAEKILEHAQLTGEWLCWEKQFDGDVLAQLAQVDAENQAKHWCDFIPQDLDLPEGLTPAQRSEGVLHWLIKGILENAREIATPLYAAQINRRMPDKTLETVGVYFSEKVYAISNVRLESRLEGLVPDVICRAQADDTPVIDLMIEVAVTHRVDERKADRIRALGLACLEIDAQQMGKGGRTTIDELRTLVLTDTKSKRWVFHPAIEWRTKVAQKNLDGRYALLGTELEAAQARAAWTKGLSAEDLLREYLGLLRHGWYGAYPTKSGGFSRLPDDPLSQLEKLGFERMDSAVLVSPRGLLWMLDAITNQNPNERAVPLFEEAMTASGPVRLQSYVTILGAAIMMYEPPMTVHEAARMKELRKIVKDSIGRGDITYARLTHYDKALSILFPRLRERLESSKGTYASTMQKLQQQKQQKREQELRQQQHDQMSLIDQSTKAKRDQLRTSLDQVNEWYEWLPKAGYPNDIATTILHVKNDLKPHSLIHQIPWMKAIETAWAFRDDQKSLEEWLQAEGVYSVQDVEARRELLVDAWMIGRKTPVAW